MAKEQASLAIEEKVWALCKKSYRQFLGKTLNLEGDQAFTLKASEKLEVNDPDEWDDDAVNEGFMALMRQPLMIFSVNAQKMIDNYEKKIGKEGKTRDKVGTGAKSIQAKIDAIKELLKLNAKQKKDAEDELKKTEAETKKAQKALDAAEKEVVKATSDKKKADKFRALVQSLGQKLGRGKEKASVANKAIEKEEIEKKIKAKIKSAFDEMAVQGERNKYAYEKIERLEKEEKAHNQEIKKLEAELKKAKQGSGNGDDFAGSGPLRQKLVEDLKKQAKRVTDEQKSAVSALKKEATKEKKDAEWSNSDNAEDIFKGLQTFDRTVGSAFNDARSAFDAAAKNNDDSRAVKTAKDKIAAYLSAQEDFTKGVEKAGSLQQSFLKENKEGAKGDLKKVNEKLKGLYIAAKPYLNYSKAHKSTFERVIKALDGGKLDGLQTRTLFDDNTGKNMIKQGQNLSNLAKAAAGDMKKADL